MKKNILITGASAGIGEATARLLHAKGHILFLTARREDRLLKIQSELSERVHIFRLDVCDYENFKQAVNQAIATMGSLDVLINNAGVGVFEPLVTAKIEDWHRMLDVNVKGILNGVHAALPHLIHSRGQVINLGSVASHQVFRDSGVYCATKFAVWAIGESLRLELSNRLRVTTLCPGRVNTDFIHHTKNDAMQQQYKTAFQEGMKAERIAEHIAFVVESPEDIVINEVIVRPSQLLSS